MPTIDDSRGVLVVRIVYDGPAMSGKTTSLRALAQGFGTTLESPEERDGRTLYFDWMDYVGGLFEGRPIRCQIVTVPGQTQLAERRARLLETADAVVVVLDSRRGELAFGMGWVRETAQVLGKKQPPVGLVVQANKRDAEDATPRDEIRAELTRIGPIALVESVATNADGTREAFVLSVRLALDRVRALSSAGQLGSGPPDDNDASQLLSRLRAAERSPTSTEAARPAQLSAVLPDVEGPHSQVSHLRDRPSEPRLRLVVNDEIVFEPDPVMPGGMIWPPVEGRTLLHEISMLDMRPTRTQRGDWWGSGSGWRMHSEREAIYADHDSARQELIEWARLHASVNKQVSSGRVVILADAGTGRLRLWQLVRVESALRERLASAMAQAEAEAVAQGMADVATRLVAARGWFREGNLNLPCTLWTIGDQAGYRPVYVGLMPRASNLTATEPQALPLVARELLPHLRELRRVRVDYPEVEARLRRIGSDAPQDSPAAWLSALTRSI
jgi:signal recognition particle receptor subunit beta